MNPRLPPSRRSRARAAALGVALGLVLGGLSAVPAHAAAPQLVTTLDDSGPGSLRAAIDAANGDADPDVITFQAGLSGTILLQSTLEITGAVTIDGTGADVALERDDAFGSFAMIRLDAAIDDDVTLIGLTLTEDGTQEGVGIHVIRAGVVTLRGLELSRQRSAQFGGCLSAITQRALVIEDSVFSSCQAPAVGGAAYIDGADSVVIRRTRFESNVASGVGGAIAVNEHVRGFEATDSAFLGNRAWVGGGLHVERADAGVVYRIARTTFSGQVSTEAASINAEILSGALRLESSTLDEHAAAPGAFAVRVVMLSGEVELSESTVTGPGGVYANTQVGQLRVENSIVDGGSAGAVQRGSGSGPTSVRYSLAVGPLDPLAVTESVLTPASSGLLPLADNGGPTWTRLPGPGSAAIDAGDPAFTPPPATDQRGAGFARVVGGRLDLGAVEVQPVSGGGSPTLPPTGRARPAAPALLAVLAGALGIVALAAAARAGARTVRLNRPAP